MVALVTSAKCNTIKWLPCEYGTFKIVGTTILTGNNPSNQNQIQLRMLDNTILKFTEFYCTNGFQFIVITCIIYIYIEILHLIFLLLASLFLLNSVTEN